ncbi:MAG: hypothetical protein ABSG03_22245 [Bryobacteraceae bacterium]
MAPQERDSRTRFPVVALAHHISISRPVLAVADLETAPPAILAWEDACLAPELDSGGESNAMIEDLERLTQRIPPLEYLQRHNWKPCRAGTRQEWVGLCPYGCGRGGDLIRFVQIFPHLPFRQSVAYLEEELKTASAMQLLERTMASYRLQLHRHPEAVG